MNLREKEILHTEQIKQIYSHEPVAFIATLINSSILAFIHWETTSHLLLISWMLSLLVLISVRYFIFKNFTQNGKNIVNIQLWENLCLGGIFVTGLLWGLGGLLLFPSDSIVLQVFTFFILGGMVAGASAIYYHLRKAFFGFAIPTLMPAIIKSLLIGDEMHISMAAMITLFAILLSITSRKNYRMNKNSLFLRIRNIGLIQSLSEAKDEVEELNKQLINEIEEREKGKDELRSRKDALRAKVEERTAELKILNQNLQSQIFKRERTEEALRDSEEKYRLLVENANDAIFILQDGAVKFCNEKTEQVTGYYANELSHTPFIQLIHPDDRNRVQENHEKRLKQEDVENPYSFRFVLRNGNIIWIQINDVFSHWDGKPATINFIRDITLKKRLQTEIYQAKKMEALVTLGEGIAHDFNNLLMGLHGLTSIMLMDTSPDHPHYKYLNKIEEISTSATELTKQLLGFASTGESQMKPTNINQLIIRTIEMFSLSKRELKVHKLLGENIWSVKIDRAKIEQTLMNLYLNGWQASSGKGDLYIQTENTMLTENFTKPFEAAPGNYVKISITDTGEGMDEETQQRIFEPFFTTRELGRGTGLGLAFVYGIIKNHHGIIKIHSEKGVGTTFSIYLPSDESQIIEEKKLFAEVATGSGTILLVDDEDLITDVGGQVLEKLGYSVLTANCGREAIKVYQEHQHKIDLIILDMMMPDMDGVEAYKKLYNINPDVIVLLSSGYSVYKQSSRVMEANFEGFIQKPFNIKELSQKLREVLNKNRNLK